MSDEMRTDGFADANAPSSTPPFSQRQSSAARGRDTGPVGAAYGWVVARGDR